MRKPGQSDGEEIVPDRREPKTPVDLAADWILDSGIQSDEGGFYAWYDLEKQSYSFLYSEITGYAITTLLFLHKTRNDERCLEKAIKAATWINSQASCASGAVRTRLYEDDDQADSQYSFCGDNVFSFDMGMVLYGMINLYKATGDETYLESSQRMADFLLGNMRKEDGSFYPICSAETLLKQESFDKWSNQSNSFHAKICLGLVDLYDITRESSYIDAVNRICDFALSRQEACGRFVTNQEDGTTHLHPHCYSAEGLLYAGGYMNSDKFINAAERATAWIYDNVTEGKIDELYDPGPDCFNDFQRSDVLAQSLRLGAVFGADTGKMEGLRSYLLKHQYLGDHDGQTGGFFYCKKGKDLNSWCTMFGLQALAMDDRRDLVPDDRRIELFI